MFEFAWPWLFAALPLPWLVYRLWRPIEPEQALHLPHPGLQLREAEQHSGLGPRGWLLLLAWLMLVIAAARPQWIGPPQAQRHSGRAMMLAVDLSGSMQTPDMVLAGRRLSRFDAIRAIAGDFISRRKGDELGLTVFGTRAFLVTPLTYDLNAVRAQLQGMAVGLPGPNTAIGDAVAIAVKRLAGLPEQARVIVLLTDGVSNAGSVMPLDAVQAAKAAGVRIYTIGIGGADAGGLLGAVFGAGMAGPSDSDLDEGLLKTMAAQTGGQYFRAADGGQLVDAYRAIDALEPLPQQGPTWRPRYEWFPWPLALAALAWLAALAVRARRREVAP